MALYNFIIIIIIYVKKTVILNTLVTMTLVPDVENNKNLRIVFVFTCKFPVSSLQC